MRYTGDNLAQLRAWIQDRPGKTADEASLMQPFPQDFGTDSSLILRIHGEAVDIEVGDWIVLDVPRDRSDPIEWSVWSDTAFGHTHRQAPAVRDVPDTEQSEDRV